MGSLSFHPKQPFRHKQGDARISALRNYPSEEYLNL